MELDVLLNVLPKHMEIHKQIDVNNVLLYVMNVLDQMLTNANLAMQRDIYTLMEFAMKIVLMVSLNKLVNYFVKVAINHAKLVKIHLIIVLHAIQVPI